MNEQFKNKQNEVALRYGFQSWSAIKWFDLQQQFEHDGIKVHPFDVLLAEVVEEFQDEVYNAGFSDGIRTVENVDLRGTVPVTGSIGITDTFTGTTDTRSSYTGSLTIETVDLAEDKSETPPTFEPSQLKATKRKKKEDSNV
jgi:hypothetical protein